MNIKEITEAKKKKEQAPIPRNFVAKHMNAVNKGGAHKDKKSYNRRDKHKSKIVDSAE